MKIRSFRLRGAPRFPELVEPPPFHDGAECGACGKPNPDGATGFFWCGECRAADCEPLPIVDLREAIYAVAHLGEPKCTAEF